MNFTRRDFLAAGAATLAASSLPAWAQSDSPKITIAFVGVAHIHTPGYVRLAKKRTDVHVKYVWDADASRAAHTASDLPGSQAVANLETIWSDPEVRAIIVLSETNRHQELVLAAARAGKNLFVEKPLGITGAESVAMADAIDRAGLIFTTGYFSRTDPKHLFLKQEIAAGHFGTLTRVRASNCHNGSLKGWFDTDWRWMADPRIAGVGAFGDLGTHKLDILLWMLGDLDRVTAVIQPVTHRYGDCDETGEALLRFKSGVIGTLAAGWVDVADPVKMLISGTRGHAEIYNDQLYYESDFVDGSDARKPLKTLPTAPKLPLEQFFDTLVGATDQPLVKAKEAAARVVAMEAIYASAREQKWVTVG